jgi:FkbM family methyltransferase
MTDDDTTLETIYGRFGRGSRGRLNMTYDYEHGTLRAFHRMARRARAERMLDIGANIGVYAVHLSGLPQMRRLHCFEPTPATYEELARNLALQDGPDRFEARQVAVSDREGTVAFSLYGEMAGNNAVEDTRVQKKVPKGSTEVACAPLDALVDATDERLAVKIDVEGHELAVIAGGGRVLTENRVLLQVECFGDHVAPLHEALLGMGYAELGRLKDDYLFVNHGDARYRQALRTILWAETAAELEALKTLRVMRRRAAREPEKAHLQVRYKRDPLLRRPRG